MTSDAEFLRRYAEGHDEPAFAELVQRHLGVVYNAALRRVHGDTHLAEEAAQMAFTDLARKARRLAEHPTLLGWLHTSTRFAATVLVRREQRRRARERTASAMESEPFAPEPSVPWETLRPLIDETLDELAAADRHAVLLRFFAGRSLAEIGGELGVSEEASRKRVTRAIERLRQRLTRRGITTTSGALAAALSAAPASAVPAALASTLAGHAMAGATVTGGVLAGALSFMSIAKISGPALAACTLAGLATLGTATLVCWHAQQRDAARQIAAAHATAGAIHARLEALARVPPTPVSVTPAPTPGTPPPTVRAADASLRETMLLARSAEFAPFRQQELRLRVQREFGPFFAERGYPPDKIAALRQALVLMFEAEENHRLARLAASADATVKPDPALVEETRAVVASLEQFLGPEESELLRRYTVAQRQEMPTVRQYGYDLADTGLTLSAAQESTLARVFAETSTTTPAGRALSHRIDPATGLSPAQQERLKRSASFLSLEQLQRFEILMRDENERTALMVRARGM
jgi:RNA polymerase sigma factor (sigma-70 family)